MMLYQTPYKKMHDSWLSIDSLNGRYLIGHGAQIDKGMIKPEEVVHLNYNSMFEFKGERLFVHSSCASSFLIQAVLVGQQIAGGTMGPLIAEPFAVNFDDLASLSIEVRQAQEEGKVVKVDVNRAALELAGHSWVLPTLHRACMLTMVVENIGSEPRRFLAAWFGKAIY